MSKIQKIKYQPLSSEKKVRKVGVPPGTMVFTGTKKMDRVVLSQYTYNEEHFFYNQFSTINELLSFPKKPEFNTWINVEGLHEVAIFEKIGNAYQFHPVLMEDIMSVNQRPKLEEFGDCLFLTMKSFAFNPTTYHLESEQVSYILGNNYLFTFQEEEGDVFKPIRERIEKGKGRVRKSKIDYLAYALIDLEVDNYFTVVERLGETIESLEDEIFQSPKEIHLRQIQQLKKDLNFLRKNIYPLREAIGKLQKEHSPLITSSTNTFLRDLYDHLIHLVDTIDTYRDLVIGLKDIYMSGISYKMNGVMKVLTVISTIFIPLTFVAGVYGTNFENVPEYTWKYGYLYFWILLVLVTGAMIYYFRKKDWF